jgi:D-alanyl-D-alanine dipeptidase
MSVSIDWRTAPIPESNSAKNALDYHGVPINLDGAANKESLVDVSIYNIASKSVYAKPIAPYYTAFETAQSKVYVREGLAEKLVEVNSRLKIYGVELLALDGFRSISLQQELWQHFIAKGKELNPAAPEEDLVKFAGQFCSDPRGYDESDQRTWPVHTTGGALDLTLRSLDDQQGLFMGSIFDDADAVSTTRYFETSESSSQSALEAKRNRRLLWHAMTSEQFTNYPYEWWHFDYGTQMWVMNGHYSDSALYGTITNTPVAEVSRK